MCVSNKKGRLALRMELQKKISERKKERKNAKDKDNVWVSEEKKE